MKQRVGMMVSTSLTNSSFKKYIVIHLQLSAFSPHPSTQPQPNPSPFPTSTLPLDFVHVSFSNTFALAVLKLIQRDQNVWVWVYLIFETAGACCFFLEGNPKPILVKPRCYDPRFNGTTNSLVLPRIWRE